MKKTFTLTLMIFGIALIGCTQQIPAFNANQNVNQNTDKPLNNTSIAYHFKLLSDSDRYKLLSLNEVFEISADVDSVPKTTEAQIKIQLPEGLTLIEGLLDWAGTLNPGNNADLFKIKLKSNGEGFYQIKGYLISDSFRVTNADGNPALGIPSFFGACVSEDIDQAKIYCKNFIPKTYESPNSPGKLELIK